MMNVPMEVMPDISVVGLDHRCLSQSVPPPEHIFDRIAGSPSSSFDTMARANPADDEIACACCSVSSVSSELLRDNDNWSLSSLSCQALSCGNTDDDENDGDGAAECHQQWCASTRSLIRIHDSTAKTITINNNSRSPPQSPRRRTQDNLPLASIRGSSATVVSRDTYLMPVHDVASGFLGDDDEASSSCGMSLVSDDSSLINDANLQLISFEIDVENPFGESPHSSNLLDTVPDELLCHVTSFLSVRDYSSFARSSTYAKRLWQEDEAGWRERCRRLWSKKACVPSRSRELLRNGEGLEAYRFSASDAVQRQSLHDEELCYDLRSGTGTVWDFRFKETAGPEWTNVDPWWRGRKARKMVFLEDGSVKQLVTTLNNGKQRKHLIPPFASDHERDERRQDLNSSEVEMKWRYVSQPMDLPIREKGSYIRLTVDGRDVPTYLAHRSPSGDWSFILESCWGVFSSSEFVPRQAPSELVPRERRPRMRLRRTRNGGGRWLNVNGIESESEDEAMELASQQYLASIQQHQRADDDSSFAVSTTTLWREALLYNNGVISLPDGENAAAEFDRLWHQTCVVPSRSDGTSVL